MRREIVVAFAVLASLLAVSAPPVMAQNVAGDLAVGSQHTDFGTGDESEPETLENMSVVGTGDSASVVASNTVDRGGDSGTGSADDRRGLEIVPNRDLSSISINLSANTAGATTAYVTETDGTVLDSASIVDERAELDAQLTNGTAYFVVVDADGATMDHGANTAATYPYESAALDIVGGVFQNTTRTEDAHSVRTISTETADAAYTSANHSEITNPEEVAVNVTLDNASASTTIQLWDGSTWQDVASSTLDSTGNHTIDISDSPDGVLRVDMVFNAGSGDSEMELHDESVLFNASAPDVDNASASPQNSAELDQADVTLEVDVNDSDFATAQNDSVTVEFFEDGSSVGTDTLTSNGTASVSITENIGGTHEWYAVATDDYGETTTSDTFEFQVPGDVTIYNETAPGDKLDSVTVTGRFYGDEEIIVNETNTASINMTNKPVDQTLILELEADGYHTRPTIIESVFAQQRVYMLHENTSTVEVRFELEDQTGGEFQSDESRLAIQKPITRDRDGDGNDETKWETVAGDTFGVAGVTVDLEQDQRYRLIVRNEDGDQRILGRYVADVSENRPLQIGEVEGAPGGGDSDWTHNVTYLNDSASSTNYVQFGYNDTQNLTDSVSVEIYERGNESHYLRQNETFDGPLGSFSITEPVPADEENKTWVVEAFVERDGEGLQLRAVVGPRMPVLGDMPGWLKALISVGTIWVVAGLFSQLNGDIGAVAVAGVGAMFWFVDFLPAEIGVGVVVLSMITAGIIFAHSRRGGGL